MTRIVADPGVSGRDTGGPFVFGGKSLTSPTCSRSSSRRCEAKGYLPYRESSPWRDLWAHALYQ